MYNIGEMLVFVKSDTTHHRSDMTYIVVLGTFT